jgi:hypothetical protein
MKPVALVERAIRNSSKSRDIVLDPFGGSGTTLIAAEHAGRRARLTWDVERQESGLLRTLSCKRPLAHSQTAINVFHKHSSMRKHQRDRVLNSRTQVAHITFSIG